MRKHNIIIFFTVKSIIALFHENLRCAGLSNLKRVKNFNVKLAAKCKHSTKLDVSTAHFEVRPREKVCIGLGKKAEIVSQLSWMQIDKIYIISTTITIKGVGGLGYLGY